MALPNAGKQKARLTGQIIIYETESTGALCAAVPLALTESEVEWNGKATVTLVKQDGTVNTRNLEMMNKLFGKIDDLANKLFRYDEDAAQSIDGVPGADIVFEADCEHKTITPDDGGEPYEIFAVKWINPLGGSAKMPPPISRKAVLAKYGSKFRALSGGTKAPDAPAPTAKKLPGPPPAQVNEGTPCSQDEAWSVLDACQKLNEEGASKVWYDAIGAQFPGKNANDLRPADWGKLREVFKTHVASL